MDITYSADCRGMCRKEIIKTILDQRGVEDYESLVDPDIEDIIPCSEMKNIGKAAEIFISGIKHHKNFFINVDSDTDGVCSGTIMYRYLSEVATVPGWYVSQGKSHGTSLGLMKKLREEHPDILIIVDSLDSYLDNYKEIKEMGIEIIVLDHHEISPSIMYDSVVTLVSSVNNYANNQLSGAGVTWKFCSYVDSLIGTCASDKLMDLAATGIIADMMDMSIPENRSIVNLGLSEKVNPAIQKILGGYDLDSTSVAFSIAPLINAACRFNENDLAFKTFICDDSKQVGKYVSQLKKIKERQNELVQGLESLCQEQINEQKDHQCLFIVIDEEEGINGLLANKILSRYKKPVLVLNLDDGRYAGSARAALDDFRTMCEDTGLCEAHGHPNAFGIFFDEVAKDRLQWMLDQKLKDMDFEESFTADVLIDYWQVDDELVDEVKEIDRISGTGFPAIRFAIDSDSFTPTTMTKGKHLVCDEAGQFKFIKWNAGNLLDEFEDYEFLGQPIRFIGTLDRGFFGRNYSRRLIVNEYAVREGEAAD